MSAEIDQSIAELLTIMRDALDLAEKLDAVDERLNTVL